jgi:hypothetical protein
MPITKKGAVATSKTTNKSTSSTRKSAEASYEEILQRQQQEASGRRIISFTMADLNSAIMKEKNYGKHTLIASDKLEVHYYAKDFKKLFTFNGKEFTLNAGYYATKKGDIWED